MRITVVLAAVLAAALLVSCGGGDEEGAPSAKADQPPAEAPVATAATEVGVAGLTADELIARLPTLAITAEDVPAGFVATRSGAVPNEMVAAGDPLPEQRLRELQEIGRVGGHQVVFEKEQAVISAVLSVFETAEGAQQGFDQGVRFGLDVEATAVDAPDVGLPAAAWQIEGKTGGGLKGYLMVARKGRINVSVAYGDAAGASRGEAEEMLRAQIAKLADLE